MTTATVPTTATATVDLHALRYHHPDLPPELVTIPAGTEVKIDDVETDDGVRSYFVWAMVGTFRAYAVVSAESLRA